MDNTWHARGTGQCPSDPRFTKYQNKNNKTTTLAVLILVAILYQDVEDILGVWGSGRVVRLDCRW